MPIVPKEILINEKVKIGGTNPFFLIGGPCVIENQDHAFFMAREIKKICEDLQISFIFKSSYDKANRSSLHSFLNPHMTRQTALHCHLIEDLG
jgi:2-dehydro-3-deoxyphosphooctonate aldolase (KDO 8-P synthase)